MKLRHITIILACIAVFAACDKDKNKDFDYTPQYQHKSPKRGVGFNFGQIPDADVSLLGPALSWSYNWGINNSNTVYSLFSQYGMDFCPMIWNTNWSEDSIRAFKAAHPSCRYLLAYNEPNLTDQANMVPSVAAKDWPRLVAIARELDMNIISPAMNYGTLAGYHDPWKWLDEFFAQPEVSIDDVDGIAIHCYMNSSTATMGFLDGFKKYGKPIWLTEFCSWGSSNSIVSEEAQIRFMVEMLNALEADKQVFRYAWFIPRANASWQAQSHQSLLTSVIPVELTNLGKVFVNMSTQDKSIWYRPGQEIPAEHYTGYTGDIHLQPTTDDSGVLDLTDLKKETAVEYQIELPEDGSYPLQLRYNTFYNSTLRVELDGQSLGLLDLPNTDYVWQIHEVRIPLKAGKHTLRLSGTVGMPVTLNWIRIGNMN